jgi:hypothetical protein
LRRGISGMVVVSYLDAGILFFSRL